MCFASLHGILRLLISVFENIGCMNCIARGICSDPFMESPHPWTGSTTHGQGGSLNGTTIHGPMNRTSEKKFAIKFALLRGLLRASSLIAGKVSSVK